MNVNDIILLVFSIFFATLLIGTYYLQGVLKLNFVSHAWIIFIWFLAVFIIYISMLSIIIFLFSMICIDKNIQISYEYFYTLLLFAFYFVSIYIIFKFNSLFKIELNLNKNRNATVNMTKWRIFLYLIPIFNIFYYLINCSIRISKKTIIIELNY